MTLANSNTRFGKQYYDFCNLQQQNNKLHLYSLHTYNSIGVSKVADIKPQCLHRQLVSSASLGRAADPTIILQFNIILQQRPNRNANKQATLLIFTNSKMKYSFIRFIGIIVIIHNYCFGVSR